MGKLTIEGKAEKEYDYDLMEITVRFQVHEKSSAYAIMKVTMQCEECLSILNEQGISMDNIRIGEDSVEQEYRNDKLNVTATREISMRLPFDTGFSNYFMELIREKEYEVDLDINPRLSKNKEINDELLKLAIEDSKNKATFIANAMNQKITGIDSVKIIDRCYEGEIDYMCLDQAYGIIPPGNLRFSNQLKAPITTKTASVEVVWIIE